MSDNRRSEWVHRLSQVPADVRVSVAVDEIASAHATIDRLDATIDRLRAENAGLRKGVPYPEFCSQPDKCAGRSNCPRDPTCAD